MTGRAGLLSGVVVLILCGVVTGLAIVLVGLVTLVVLADLLGLLSR